jgi:hypothetical protein
VKCKVEAPTLPGRTWSYKELLAMLWDNDFAAGTCVPRSGFSLHVTICSIENRDTREVIGQRELHRPKSGPLGIIAPITGDGNSDMINNSMACPCGSVVFESEDSPMIFQ